MKITLIGTVATKIAFNFYWELSSYTSVGMKHLEYSSKFYK